MPKRIAIVGASNNRRKYGNKAVRAFRDGGWEVFPVNPGCDEIEGLPAYASVADVPGPIDRVAMYVPPRAGLAMIDDIAAKAPAELFLNPGTESPELVAAAEARGLNVIQACTIVNIGLRPDMYPDE